MDGEDSYYVPMIVWRFGRWKKIFDKHIKEKPNPYYRHYEYPWDRGGRCCISLQPEQEMKMIEEERNKHRVPVNGGDYDGEVI